MQKFNHIETNISAVLTRKNDVITTNSPLQQSPLQQSPLQPFSVTTISVATISVATISATTTSYNNPCYNNLLHRCSNFLHRCSPSRIEIGSFTIGFMSARLTINYLGSTYHWDVVFVLRRARKTIGFERSTIPFVRQRVG